MNTAPKAEAAPSILHVAWLRPLADGYVIPVWRWILLPGSAWMLRRNGGVWVSGQLELLPDALRFTQTKLVKLSAPLEWTVSLDLVTDISVKKGLASETIELLSSEGKLKFMAVRSEEFVEGLRQALATR